MRKNVLIFMVMIVCVSFNGIILAQGTEEIAQEAETVNLEPIVVSASRLGRILSQAPSSASVITRAEIEDSAADSVPDLLKNVEGIYTYDASGIGINGRVNMRGFWGGMSTYQLVLIDGIPQNSGKDKLIDWNLIDLDNVERIEIIRGPASSLYGDNAVSGVINIITKRPSETTETKISASYGSFNTQNYSISTSGKHKRIGYYLRVNDTVTDGFRRHCDYKDINLNSKFDYTINDTQMLKLSLDYNKSKRGAYPWALTESQIIEDRRQARPGTENDTGKEEKFDIGIMHCWDVSEILSTEEVFYYRNEDSKSFYTSTSSESRTREQLGNEDTYGLLLSLNINPEIFKLEHSLTTGIDLERNDFDYEEYSAPYQARGSIRNDYVVKREKVGVYLQDEIKFFEVLRLISGLRYDSIKFDFNNKRDESSSEKVKMFKTSPSIGLVYNYDNDSNVYANYSNAFRTPTIGQMFTYGSSSNTGLKPEEALNYEVGIRHFFYDYLTFNASLYWMRIDNEIWYDYATSKYENYGKTSHKGVDAGLNFKIIKEITGFANYSYIRAKNEKGDYSGQYLANVPLYKTSLGLNLKPIPELNINLALNKIGNSYIDSENNDKLSSYFTVDTKITYQKDWYLLFLTANNLLGKEYNSYGYKSSSGRRTFSPAPERRFEAGMSITF
ncbi:MAG: TonB-dependent receptor [Candidatus Orphnella occulta]|nr:TonB-dependent receptor [Candidatus Orphnella occulta]MDP8297618.1 TonB-dependent receptor [Candidatus Orphnella occulta]